MKTSTISVIDNSTPFKVIAIANFEIRLYWTLKKGMYGYQVVTAIFKDHSFYAESKTSGYGYCKESEATTLAFQSIRIQPKKWLNDNKLNNYHVGGNYYRVSKSNTKKFKRG